MRILIRLAGFLLLLTAAAIMVVGLQERSDDSFSESAPTESMVAEENVEPLEPEPLYEGVEAPDPEIAGESTDEKE